MSIVIIGKSGDERSFLELDKGWDKGKQEGTYTHEKGVRVRDISKMNFLSRFFVWAFAKNTIQIGGKTYLVGERSLEAFTRRNKELFPSLVGKFDIKRAIQDLQKAKGISPAPEVSMPLNQQTIVPAYEALGITDPKVQAQMNQELFKDGVKEVTKQQVQELFDNHRKDIHPRDDMPAPFTHLAQALHDNNPERVQEALNEPLAQMYEEEFGAGGSAPAKPIPAPYAEGLPIQPSMRKKPEKAKTRPGAVEYGARLRQLDKSGQLKNLNKETAIQLLKEMYGKDERVDVILLNIQEALMGKVGADELLKILSKLSRATKL